jgi:cyanophycinase
VPAKLAPDRSRGVLVPIGGQEELEGQATILKRFIATAGQRPAIVMISALAVGDDSADDLEAALMAHGAGQVRIVALNSRGDGEKRDALDALERADAAYLVGVQPLRMSTLLGGTPLARLLRRRNAEGMMIAGSAAGAAIMAEHMLAGGATGGGSATPRMGGATLAPGLGLSNRVVIDQGGGAADRLGRLLGALALNPFALGLGLDPNTAAFIGADNVFDVVGSGGITVVDPADMGQSNVADAGPSAPISLTNLRVHVLVHGARYDLDFRRPL